jgi:hypothetical protein
MRAAIVLSTAALLAGCGHSSDPESRLPVDAHADSASACERVGVSLCKKAYACHSPSELARYQYPATEAECVALENSFCASSIPGFCAGRSRWPVSAKAATECAQDLDAVTCEDFDPPLPQGACKAQLCSEGAPAKTPEQLACESVAVAWCKKMYACHSPSELAGYQYAPTEAQCVASQSATCIASQPGICMGRPQASAAAATACAQALDDLTCETFDPLMPQEACKAQLCAS